MIVPVVFFSALTLVSQSQDASPSAPEHVGSYVPVSQLLSWCKSRDPNEFSMCFGYVSGVVNSAGSLSSTWPEGPVALPADQSYGEIIKLVVKYIEGQRPEEFSRPASDAVYAAVVARYPYKKK